MKRSFRRRWFSLLVVGFASLLVCSTSVCAAAKSATVALVFDLSSRDDEPEEIVRGFELAAEDLRASGITLSITKFDSKSNAVGTRLAMAQVLKTPPDLIVAEVNSSKAFIAAEMAEKAGRFMLTPLASAPEITNGKRFIFRASYTDDFQGNKLAQFARENLNAKRVAVLWDAGQLYSKALADAFRTHFVQRGGDVVLDERLSSNKAEFTEVLNKVAALNVDLVFLPVYEDLAAKILNHAGRLKLKIPNFLGGDGWYPRDIFSDLVHPERLSFGMYWVSQFQAESTDPARTKLIQSIEKRFRNKLNPSIAAGYDSGLIIGELLKSVPPKFTQLDLVKGMERLNILRGLTTTFQYGSEKSPKKPLYVLKMTKHGSVFYKELAP